MEEEQIQPGAEQSQEEDKSFEGAPDVGAFPEDVSVGSIDAGPADEEIISDAGNTTDEPAIDTESEAAMTKQSEYVRDLALVLFDQTESLHELKDGSRRVLAEAALLQGNDLQRGRKKAVKAAHKLVQEQVSGDFTPQEENVLVALIVLKNAKVKSKDFAALDLDPMQQREALTLLAILRIAQGLDESGSQETAIHKVELSRVKMWIVVDGPEVAVDLAAAQHNAWLWAKVGYPRVKLLEAAEAQKKLPPYPELTDEPGVETGDSLAETCRKILRYHFARMLDHEDGTRLGENIEDLHRMRVATRRMRAAFQVFGDAFEPQAIKPYLKGLRKIGRTLGRVRDLDVFMDKAQRHIDQLPEDQRQGMIPLLEDWVAQRESARAEMVVYLDSEEYQTFKRKYNMFLSKPGAGALPIPHDIPIPHQVREIAPVLTYTRLAAARAYDPFLVDASIELLHALRIELKRFRYTVEFFREVLGDEVGQVIDDLKMLQDHLGDLNDSQVAAQFIQKFLDNWDIEQENLPVSERQNAEAIVSYLASRHAELHRLTATFAESWQHFNRPEFRRNLALAISVL